MKGLNRRSGNGLFQLAMLTWSPAQRPAWRRSRPAARPPRAEEPSGAEAARTSGPPCANFTVALGVQCDYCHVMEPTRDLASDEKQTKKTARVMLQMVGARQRDVGVRRRQAGRGGHQGPVRHLPRGSGDSRNAAAPPPPRLRQLGAAVSAGISRRCMRTGSRLARVSRARNARRRPCSCRGCRCRSPRCTSRAASAPRLRWSRRIHEPSAAVARAPRGRRRW